MFASIDVWELPRSTQNGTGGHTIAIQSGKMFNMRLKCCLLRSDVLLGSVWDQTSSVDQMFYDDQPVPRKISDSRRPRTISDAVQWVNMFMKIACVINIEYAIFIWKSTKMQYNKIRVIKLAMLIEPKNTHYIYIYIYISAIKR